VVAVVNDDDPLGCARVCIWLGAGALVGLILALVLL
jgi:hypothetical protein